MTRAEFSKKTKLDAWRVSRGRCMKCTAKLSAENTEYHHDKECTFGGEATLENCIVLCRTCHSLITRERAAVIAKSNRIRDRFIGITKTRKPMPGSRASGLKKKIDGTVVPRVVASRTWKSASARWARKRKGTNRIIPPMTRPLPRSNT